MSNSLVRKFASRAATEAFTLLELLVVIVIIIILIGFLFPAFRGVQDQAKRAQAKNDLNQIVTAVNAFYTEYGKYPVDSSKTTDALATYSNINSLLFDVLRYDITRDATGVPLLNPRQVVFIEPPTAKDQTTPKSGIKVVGSNGGVWFDPWGFPYNVRIDANYNSVTKADDNPGYTDLVPTFSTAPDGTDLGVRTGIIAWSVGADGTLGTNNNKIYKDPTTGIPSDDVISWQ